MAVRVLNENRSNGRVLHLHKLTPRSPCNSIEKVCCFDETPLKELKS